MIVLRGGILADDELSMSSIPSRRSELDSNCRRVSSTDGFASTLHRKLVADDRRNDRPRRCEHTGFSVPVMLSRLREPENATFSWSKTLLRHGRWSERSWRKIRRSRSPKSERLRRDALIAAFEVRPHHHRHQHAGRTGSSSFTSSGAPEQYRSTPLVIISTQATERDVERGPKSAPTRTFRSRSRLSSCGRVRQAAGAGRWLSSGAAAAATRATKAREFFSEAQEIVEGLSRDLLSTRSPAAVATTPGDQRRVPHAVHAVSLLWSLRRGDDVGPLPRARGRSSTSRLGRLRSHGAGPRSPLPPTSGQILRSREGGRARAGSRGQGHSSRALSQVAPQKLAAARCSATSSIGAPRRSPSTASPRTNLQNGSVALPMRVQFQLDDDLRSTVSRRRHGRTANHHVPPHRRRASIRERRARDPRREPRSRWRRRERGRGAERHRRGGRASRRGAAVREHAAARREHRIGSEPLS